MPGLFIALCVSVRMFAQKVIPFDYFVKKEVPLRINAAVFKSLICIIGHQTVLKRK